MGCSVAFLNKDIIDLNLEYYNKNYFQHLVSSQKICIEKSTSYYENESSAKLISELLPNTKIIFLLRNPAERALSNYFFSLNHGLERRTLEEVFIHEHTPPILKKTITSVNPFDYLKRGVYLPYIEMYSKYFSIFDLAETNTAVQQNFKGTSNYLFELYNERSKNIFLLYFRAAEICAKVSANVARDLLRKSTPKFRRKVVKITVTGSCY